MSELAPNLRYCTHPQAPPFGQCDRSGRFDREAGQAAIDRKTN